ncbi:MAG: cytochrome P450 [Chloroflexaceae bacterium]|nr:cytochrome P450 [Chloroflexaceae bacterium]
MNSVQPDHAPGESLLWPNDGLETPPAHQERRMFNADFINNPYPTYAYLRATAPLHWSDAWRTGAWIVPRYADVAAALHDPRLSSQRRLIDPLPRELQPEFAALDAISSRWLLFLDPPFHTRLRKLLSLAFAPRAIEQLRPRIQHLADKQLDQVAGEQRMEFITGVAHPFPVLVIAEMLGIPSTDRSHFQAWSDDFIQFFGNPQPTLEVTRQAQASVIALTDYFRAMLPERRQRPGDDLVSLLLHVEGDDGLTEEELLAQCALLLVAGHETTRNLLGNGLLALLQHPDQWAMLKQDATLMRSAIRELLRYNSPVQLAGRTALQDFVWHEQQIQEGQTVIVLMGAANHDSAQFNQPEQLNLRRDEGQPLSYGYGPHFCIGAMLANLEAESVFSSIIRRMPTLELADTTPRWCPNVAFRGLMALPVTW